MDRRLAKTAGEGDLREACCLGSLPAERVAARLLLAMMVGLTLSRGSAAVADGFHNAALATSSLEDWLKEVEQAVPQLKGAFGTSEWRGGRDIDQLRKQGQESGSGEKSPRGLGRGLRGRLDVTLTPMQQQVLMRKGKDCLEVLAFLEAKNVFPHEFPTFPMQRIPQYRDAAKRVLHVMGREGTRAVAGELRAALMGQTTNPYGVPLHPNYYKDLLELLQAGTAAGDLSRQEVASLLEATQGRKAQPGQAALAEQVRKATSLEQLDLNVLLEMAREETGSEARRRIYAAARKKLDSASTLELLKIVAELDDTQLVSLAAAEAEKRTPTAKEVENDLAEYWRLAGSSNRRVATVARSHVALLFQQTKMSTCLHWIGQGDAQLAKLIWEQIDGRVERADESRRASYGNVGLKVALHEQFSQASRKAAMELLVRLKSREVAADLVEGLPKLPRELWGPAGDTLQRLTGQNFGPRAGDDFARLVESQKKWQEWLRHEGNR